MEPVEVIDMSYSRLAVLTECDYKFHLQYELGYKPAVTPSYFEFGTMGHKFLEAFYKAGGILGGEQAIEAVQEAIKAEIAAGRPFDLISRVSRLAMKYAREYAPMADEHWEEILGVEKEVAIERTTRHGFRYRLNGKIDLITKMRDGKVWSVDHKYTGQQFIKNSELAMDPQMSIYTAALRELGYDAFGVLLNQLKSYDYKKWDQVTHDQLFSRETSYRTPVEVGNLWVNLDEQVETHITRLANTDLRPKNLRRECSKCQFQDVCLMSLKGVNPQDILDANFIKRGEGEPKSASGKITIGENNPCKEGSTEEAGIEFSALL